MIHKIKDIEALLNLILKNKFENNEVKYYDMKNIIEKFKEFDVLKNENIFNNSNVDVGDYAVVWSYDLDIACEELYINGVSKIEE